MVDIFYAMSIKNLILERGDFLQSASLLMYFRQRIYSILSSFPSPLDMTEQMLSEMSKITIDDVNKAFKDSFRKEKVVDLVRYPAE